MVSACLGQHRVHAICSEPLLVPRRAVVPYGGPAPCFSSRACRVKCHFFGPVACPTPSFFSSLSLFLDHSVSPTLLNMFIAISSRARCDLRNHSPGQRKNSVLFLMSSWGAPWPQRGHGPCWCRGRGSQTPRSPNHFHIHQPPEI